MGICANASATHWGAIARFLPKPSLLSAKRLTTKDCPDEALPGMLHPIVVTANGLDVPNSEGYSTNILLMIIEVAIIWNGSQG